MWSWVKSIFTSSDLVESVSKGIDKSFFTDEEKADNWDKMLKLYEPFKMAQRLIALGLLALLGLGFFTAVILRCSGLIWYTPTADELNLILAGKYIPEYIQASDWVLANTYKLFFEPFLWAVGFYFGGGAAEGVVSRWKDSNKKFEATVIKKGQMDK